MPMRHLFQHSRPGHPLHPIRCVRCESASRPLLRAPRAHLRRVYSHLLGYPDRLCREVVDDGDELQNMEVFVMPGSDKVPVQDEGGERVFRLGPKLATIAPQSQLFRYRPRYQVVVGHLLFCQFRHFQPLEARLPEPPPELLPILFHIFHSWRPIDSELEGTDAGMRRRSGPWWLKEVWEKRIAEASRGRLRRIYDEYATKGQEVPYRGRLMFTLYTPPANHSSEVSLN